MGMTDFLNRVAYRLREDDNAKAMLVMLKEEELVSVTQLTVHAQQTALRLGQMKLVEVIQYSDRGARYAALILTKLGVQLVKEHEAQWIDELQKWAELEGEQETITHRQEAEQEAKQIQHFRKHLNDG